MHPRVGITLDKPWIDVIIGLLVGIMFVPSMDPVQAPEPSLGAGPKMRLRIARSVDIVALLRLAGFALVDVRAEGDVAVYQNGGLNINKAMT